MKPFIKDALRILKKNWLSLFLFELIYRIFFMAALVNGSGIMMEICLKRLGYSYLTAENYGKFISDPLTIFLMVFGAVLICLALVFELYAVFSCYECSWRGKKISVPAMIRFGGLGTVRFVRRYPLKWLFYMMGCSPYLCIHFLVWEVMQTKFLQFSIRQISGRVWQLSVILIFALVIFVLSMLFAFTMPRRIMTLERPDGIMDQWKWNMKENWKRNLCFSIVVQLFATFVVLILYLLSLVLMVVYVMTVRSSGTMVSAVLIYGRLIRYSAGFVVGGVGMVFTLLYLYTFFARSDKKNHYCRARAGRKSRFKQILTSRWMMSAVTFCMIFCEVIYLAVEVTPNLSGMAAARSAVEVTAHRGGAKMAPENTLSSMKYAVKAMADVAEIDVQETKDGVIVLLHDTNLKRTTGINANIWDLTYEEVSQLDAGVKFNKKFLGEQIPTLEQVIQYCKGKIRLNIEVKYNGHNKNIVQKVVNIIEDNDFINDCVLTSMNYKFLKEAKKENPKIRTGYTLKMTYGDLSQLEDVDFFSVKHTYINRKFVEQVHKLGKEVYAWTLNYQGDMQRMVNMRVDNIITDEPELVRKVILGETDRNPSFWTLLKYAVR